MAAIFMILNPVVQLYLSYRIVRLGLAILVASLFYALFSKLSDWAFHYIFSQMQSFHFDGIVGYIFSQLDLVSALNVFLSIVSTYSLSVSTFKLFERFYRGN